MHEHSPPLYDVFLSFDGDQLPRVEEICAGLRAAGRKAFIDRAEIRPGESISARIEHGLRNSTMLVAYYSARYAIRHGCQFELIHAFISNEREGGESRILLVNPEPPDRRHIAGVDLYDRLYIVDDSPGKSPAEIVEMISDKLSRLNGTFKDIDFNVRPRSYGGTPTVEARVHRYTEMWNLHSALTHGRHRVTQLPGNSTAVLTGLPGSGKTTLVQSYVLYFGYEYSAGVHWVDLSGSGENLVEAYAAESARALGIDVTDTTAVLSAVQNALVERAHGARLLWIVDNVPPDLTSAEAQALVFDIPGVHTVLISEGAAMSELGRCVTLNGLTEDEAFVLVAQHFIFSDEEKPLVQSLVDHVSRHPMAIVALAEGAAERLGLGSLAEHVGRVLDGSSSDLDRVRAMIADQLQHRDDDSLTLLRLAAVCGPHALPVRFICRLLNGFGINDERVLTAMRGLQQSYRAHRDDAYWSTHSVVRDTVRRLFHDPVQEAELAEAAAVWFTDHDDDTMTQDLLPHARHLCDRGGLPAHVEERLVRCLAFRLLDAHYPATAARYFDRLLDGYPINAQDVAVLIAAATSHLQAREHERAARKAQQATRLPGSGVTALLLLASALDANGFYDEAEATWREVIEHNELAAMSFSERVAVKLQWVRGRRLRGYLKEHRAFLHSTLERADELPDHVTCQVRMELANIQMATDGQEEARELADKVVRHFESAGAPHDPLASEARFLQANADMTLGMLELKPDMNRWKEAESRLRKLLAEQEVELGTRNIATLTTRTAIGWALVSQGKAVEARDHTKALLEVLEKCIGRDHPLYSRASYTLGMAYFQLGKFAQALEHLDNAHRGQLVGLGEAHPETLQTQFQLGMALRMADPPDKARSNALIDRVRLFSPRVTGRLNDLYGMSFAASVLRYAPRRMLLWAHRKNHQHKWQDD